MSAINKCGDEYDTIHNFVASKNIEIDDVDFANQCKPHRANSFTKNGITYYKLTYLLGVWVRYENTYNFFR